MKMRVESRGFIRGLVFGNESLVRLGGFNDERLLSTLAILAIVQSPSISFNSPSLDSSSYDSGALDLKPPLAFPLRKPRSPAQHLGCWDQGLGCLCK